MTTTEAKRLKMRFEMTRVTAAQAKQMGCVYSDGQIVSRGEHQRDKDGFCIICGDKVETAKQQQQNQTGGK